MKILDKEIGYGRTVLNLDIAKLHTGTRLEVPVIIERSKKPGPTLLLIAGIHGNEVNGVEIVRQIIRAKYNKPASGTVICIPVVNVFGFLNQEREFPDGRDLNRLFPGTKKGSLASRFAFYVMQHIVPVVDYIFIRAEIEDSTIHKFELIRTTKRVWSLPRFLDLVLSLTLKTEINLFVSLLLI